MQNLPWKKILLIIGFIIVTIALGYAIYYLFFRVEPITPVQEEAGQISELPIAQPGEIIPGEITNEVVTPTVPTGPTVVSQVPVPPETTVDNVAQGSITTVTDLDYATTPFISLDSTGNNLYTYNQDTGEFYQLDQFGQKIKLTDKTFADVQDIAWAPNTQKAIMEFPDGSNILYDFSTDKQVTLPKNWTEFDFNESETQIAFKDMDPNQEKRFLAVASPDGSNQNYLEFLGNKDQQVEVLFSSDDQIVANFKDASNLDYSKIYFIGQNNENYRTLEANGYNVEMQFSPTENKVLYSAHNMYSDNKPVLYLADVAGDASSSQNTSLNLNTWASKCTFSNSSTVYCAVPKEMPEGAGWFPELADDVGDYIYKINLETGSKSFVAEPEFEYAIDQLQVSEDGSNLYFTDKNTQTVHKIKLK